MPTHQEAVLAAAQLGKQLLAVYPDTLKTCCLYAVGLGDAKDRLTQAMPVLNGHVGNPLHLVNLTPDAAMGAVYTAAQRLQGDDLFQHYPSLQSEISQANFKLLETYCKNTPGTIPTNPL